jgi:hypothetical protein
MKEHEPLSKILHLETGIKNALEKCDLEKNMLIV